MSAAQLIRHPGEGERVWFAGGGVLTLKATAAQTGGSFFLLEDEMARGKTTPLHTHPADEALYVLDGELLVHLDGEEHRVGTGGFALFPRDVPHAFLVTSERARILAVAAPGDGWAFFEELTEPATSEADAQRPADIPRLIETARRSPHIEVLGPPPFEAVTAGAGAPAASDA
mgnify:CR=1 FL=1